MSQTNPRFADIAKIMGLMYDPSYMIPETVEVTEGEFGLGGLTARIDPRRPLGRFTRKEGIEISHLAKPESDMMGLQLCTGWLIYGIETGQVLPEDLKNQRMENWWGSNTERHVLIDGTYCYGGRIDPNTEEVLGRMDVTAMRESSKNRNLHLEFAYSLTGSVHGRVHSGTMHIALLRENLHFGRGGSE